MKIPKPQALTIPDLGHKTGSLVTKLLLSTMGAELDGAFIIS